MDTAGATTNFFHFVTLLTSIIITIVRFQESTKRVTKSVAQSVLCKVKGHRTVFKINRSQHEVLTPHFDNLPIRKIRAISYTMLARNFMGKWADSYTRTSGMRATYPVQSMVYEAIS